MTDFKFIKTEPITKGWSSDKKYHVTDSVGHQYLLRISSLDKYDTKKWEYAMMLKAYRLGVPMPEPINFGACSQGVYCLQGWIEGMDAEAVIPTLPKAQQYVYGLEAGRILKKIHSIPATNTQESWEVRFNRKIDRKIKLYTDCSIKYQNGERLIEYINQHRYLLASRPQAYQHGDYHIGNMMIDSASRLNIIDFDRSDYGDPWEEFNRIVWCAQISPLFASGMVNGYFENKVPLEFWQLLALYISSNTLSSLPWAVPFGQSQIETMKSQEKEILQWYDNMQNVIPIWFSLYESTLNNHMQE